MDLEVWTNGPSDNKPTIRWQVNTAIEHVFAQNSGTKSDTLSDCGQLSKVIQQLKPLRETAIATMAGNTRPGHDQENFNCQFARYAFNLTSFPSGCVWKWGTPMYSHNGNLKDLKADLRIITLFSDKPFIHFIWQRLAKKQVHPSDFTSDSTPEFLKKHGQFRVCHRTSGQTTTCHLAETSISEGTHVEYCRNAIDLRLYASMHWISQTFPLAPGSKAKSSAKIKWIQVARNKVPRE